MLIHIKNLKSCLTCTIHYISITNIRRWGCFLFYCLCRFWSQDHTDFIKWTGSFSSCLLWHKLFGKGITLKIWKKHFLQNLWLRALGRKWFLTTFNSPHDKLSIQIFYIFLVQFSYLHDLSRFFISPRCLNDHRIVDSLLLWF